MLQASTAGLQDIVVDVQQAMVYIALTFHPGTICFKSQNTVSHGPHMQEAVTHSGMLTQTVSRRDGGLL